MGIIHLDTAFEDERGRIIDILENENISSITIISSKKGSVRGNHYHKKTTQYTYVLEGSLKLLTQVREEKVETVFLKPGDLILTPPMEKHTLIAMEDSEFLVLTRGPRGGKDYEKDTYRLTEKLTDLELESNSKTV